MKLIILFIILVLIIGFYIVIKRQNEYNQEELNRAQILAGVSNFAAANIADIQSQKFSPVDRFVNSKFVTTTSGIFGKVWGMIV